MIIINVVIFNILDHNVCSKEIYTRGARSTLSDIIGSVRSL